MKSALISVIVPTRNRCSLLAQTLESIYHQSLSKELYEVVVVDNSSTDNTNEVIEQFQRYPDFNLRAVREPKLGLMFARHAGARAAASDILLYTDDDIIADAQWVERIYGCFDDAEIAAVGGRVIPKFEAAVPSWLYQFGNEENCGVLSAINLGPGVSLVKPPKHLFGCNFAIRKKILFQVGGFNPDGFPKHLIKYRGDGECGLIDKLQERELKIKYDSEAIVYHVITENRLRKEYFLNRAHLEGISKAYAVLRKAKLHNRSLVLIDDIIYSIVGILYLQMWKLFCPDVDKKFRLQFQTVYLKSRARHAARLLTDDKLRNFVLLEDYINCKDDLVEN